MRKRSSYRPRPVIKDPLGYLAKLSPQHRDAINLRNHISLEKILKGDGDGKDWDEITAALNIGVILDVQVYGGEHNALFVTASNCHATCGERSGRLGRILYSGPELTAVRLALEIHDEQMAQATTIEIDRAVREAQRLLKAGHINPVQKAARLQKETV